MLLGHNHRCLGPLALCFIALCCTARADPTNSVPTHAPVIAATNALETVASDSSTNATDAVATNRLAAASTNVMSKAAVDEAITNAIAQVTETSDQRGTAEADSLRDEIHIKTLKATRDQKWKWRKLLPFLFYTSLRVNGVSGGGQAQLTDGGSRVGAIYDKALQTNTYFFARVELGFNLLDEVSYLLTPDASAASGNGRTVFTPRLYYAGYEWDEWKGLVGKNWSPYYDVAGMTDSFAVFGGKAAGVYSGGTDGGGSGTGRADNALQLHRQRGPWRLGAQGQLRTDVPTFDDLKYDYAFGGSARYRSDFGLQFGVAYNQASPDSLTDAAREQGLTGDDRTWAAVLSYNRDRVYVATAYAMSRNHETDDTGQFFRARGWELYGRFSVIPRIRVIGGCNVLVPNDETYTAPYRVEEYIAGAQIALGEKPTFDTMIYAEAVHDNGNTTDNESLGEALALGVRWRVSW